MSMDEKDMNDETTKDVAAEAAAAAAAASVAEDNGKNTITSSFCVIHLADLQPRLIHQLL